MTPIRRNDNARALLARVDESLGKRRPASKAETSLLAAYRLTLARELESGDPKAATLRTVRALLLRRETLTAPPRLSKRMRWLARRADAFIEALEESQ